MPRPLFVSPLALKPSMTTLMTFKVPPVLNLMPLMPVLAPSRVKLVMVTTSVAPALTLMPVVPEPRMPPLATPPPSMVIDLVIVTAPKPPGSSALMMPPGAVLEMAPAKVLQGAVRLQGLASSPTPETQVRVACANAAVLINIANKKIDAVATNCFLLLIIFFPLVDVAQRIGPDAAFAAAPSPHSSGTYAKSPALRQHLP